MGDGVPVMIVLLPVATADMIVAMPAKRNKIRCGVMRRRWRWRRMHVGCHDHLRGERRDS
jgi:hypothetical protein